MRLLVVARMALPLLVLAMSANIWANPIRTRDSSLVLRIELAERVEVAQAYVKLADIARLHSMELETLRHAMAVPLGSAPRSGETVTLDRARLARWLRAQLGLEASQIQWSGASATQISRSSAEISGNEILAVAQAALRKYLEESLAKYPNARIELLAGYASESRSSLRFKHSGCSAVRERSPGQPDVGLGGRLHKWPIRTVGCRSF